MTFWEKIKLIFSKIWEFLEPFVRIFTTQSGIILAELAMKAVTTVAETMQDKDGEAKRKEAFKMIKKELIDREIELGASVINSAIEAAVQKLKASGKQN